MSLGYVYSTIPNTTSNSTQALSFNVTDIERNVFLSCTDTCSLRLMLASDILNRKIPSGAKLVISQGDRSDVFTINSKTQGNSADQPTSKQQQPSTDNQTAHTKQDLLSLSLASLNLLHWFG